MDNKRGQGLSTNAIILIILGVVVLVVLILGFTMGWSTLKGKIMGSKSNVDTISEACTLACSINSVYDYCNMKRELTDEKGNVSKDVTCYMLSLDNNLKRYGIQPCNSINCKGIVKCADWKYFNKNGELQDIFIGSQKQTGSTDATDYCYV
jgi:hypothetical protein